MPIRIGVPRETAAGERRVALVPDVVSRLKKLGVEVLLESGAGDASFYADADYTDATIVDSAERLYRDCEVIFRVQPPGEAEIDHLQDGKVVVGFMLPFRYPERVAKMRDKGVTSFAMELIPRISRAQSMDALSSQASVAGYSVVLMGASLSGRFFPMLTTAAGTIRPARVLVIGAGVAGLQAIATARRLGAIVEAYDIRAAAKEQVESLGAKLVDIGMDAESMGGYARELNEDEKKRQAEVLARHIAEADVVISTASVPGKPAPRIITAGMVDGMKAGAVIVDLAAENGGNCELTRAGETVQSGEVQIHGPLNLASELPVHASEMYARNLLNFITPMIGEDGALALDWDDQVIADSVLTHGKEIRPDAVRRHVEGDDS